MPTIRKQRIRKQKPRLTLEQAKIHFFSRVEKFNKRKLDNHVVLNFIQGSLCRDESSDTFCFQVEIVNKFGTGLSSTTLAEIEEEFGPQEYEILSGEEKDTLFLHLYYVRAMKEV